MIIYLIDINTFPTIALVPRGTRAANGTCIGVTALHIRETRLEGAGGCTIVLLAIPRVAIGTGATLRPKNCVRTC